MSEHADDANSALLLVINNIPAGRVATYGQVAQLAGLPGQARRVGQILKRLPHESDIPWHRVINAKGQISLPESGGAKALQQRRLACEGVVFERARIDLKRFRWRP
jgi:methylated-DNA-protein-cysteine methyltransferase-like protein